LKDTGNDWPKAVKIRSVRVKTVMLHEVVAVPVAVNQAPTVVGKKQKNEPNKKLPVARPTPGGEKKQPRKLVRVKTVMLHEVVAIQVVVLLIPAVVAKRS
jgi:hypothetical protein